MESGKPTWDQILAVSKNTVGNFYSEQPFFIIRKSRFGRFPKSIHFKTVIQIRVWVFCESDFEQNFRTPRRRSYETVAELPDIDPVFGSSLRSFRLVGADPEKNPFMSIKISITSSGY